MKQLQHDILYVLETDIFVFNGLHLETNKLSLPPHFVPKLELAIDLSHLLIYMSKRSREATHRNIAEKLLKTCLKVKLLITSTPDLIILKPKCGFLC
jgi:AAA+ superfamily predicted ATPase